jgi:hypothetical protein
LANERITRPETTYSISWTVTGLPSARTSDLELIVILALICTIARDLHFWGTPGRHYVYYFHFPSVLNGLTGPCVFYSVISVPEKIILGLNLLLCILILPETSCSQQTSCQICLPKEFTTA